jgi:UDPglucose 6-dehydrogenase
LFLNAGPGYGGSCLPKDMKALISFADKIGINPILLNAVEKTNQKQIQNIVSLMEKTLGALTSKRITVLGTAFKPNTDDVRDSIAIELIKKLLKKKSRITIYDPKAMKNTRNIFGEKIIYAKSVNDALNKSQCTILMTYWKQFERLDNNSMKHMSKKFIIDCRRILVEKELHGEYHAIGIGKI